MIKRCILTTSFLIMNLIGFAQFNSPKFIKDVVNKGSNLGLSGFTYYENGIYMTTTLGQVWRFDMTDSSMKRLNLPVIETSMMGSPFKVYPHGLFLEARLDKAKSSNIFSISNDGNKIDLLIDSIIPNSRPIYTDSAIYYIKRLGIVGENSPVMKYQRFTQKTTHLQHLDSVDTKVYLSSTSQKLYVHGFIFVASNKHLGTLHRFDDTSATLLGRTVISSSEITKPPQVFGGELMYSLIFGGEGKIVHVSNDDTTVHILNNSDTSAQTKNDVLASDSFLAFPAFVANAGNELVLVDHQYKNFNLIDIAPGTASSNARPLFWIRHYLYAQVGELNRANFIRVNAKTSKVDTIKGLESLSNSKFNYNHIYGAINQIGFLNLRNDTLFQYLIQGDSAVPFSPPLIAPLNASPPFLIKGDSIGFTRSDNNSRTNLMLYDASTKTVASLSSPVINRTQSLETDELFIRNGEIHFLLPGQGFSKYEAVGILIRTSADLRILKPQELFSSIASYRPSRLYSTRHNLYVMMSGQSSSDGAQMVRYNYASKKSSLIDKGANANSHYYNLQIVGNKLFYMYLQSDNTYEFWVYDEASGSSTKLPDILYNSGKGVSFDEFVVVGDRLFFTATHENNNVGIYVTDGTDKGTYKIGQKKVGSRHYPYDIRDLAPLRDSFLMFQSLFEGKGYGWCITDGTEGGTQFLGALHDKGYRVTIDDVTQADDHVYFSFENQTGQELWTSDGTETGTHLVRGMFGDPDASYDGPLGFFGENDRFYFKTYTYPGGSHDIWSTDGTDTGTTKHGNTFNGVDLGLILSGSDNAVVGSKGIYFLGNEETQLNLKKQELYFWNPISRTLTPIKSSLPSEGSNPENLTLEGDYLYYLATDSVHLKEIWYLAIDCITGDVEFEKEVCQNKQVAFMANVHSDGGFSVFQWQFGDNGTSNAQNPKYTYADDGRYLVSLNLSDSLGCERVYKDSIRILATPTTSSILGPVTTTYNRDTFRSTSTATDGRMYVWSVTNGTILSGQNTSEIIVRWDQRGVNATVQVREVGSNGCEGELESHVTAIDQHSGVNKTTTQTGISIYPNPSPGDLTIATQELTGIGSILIFDGLGRIVQHIETNFEEDISLSLNGNPGIYRIQIISELGSFVQTVLLIE